MNRLVSLLFPLLALAASACTAPEPEPALTTAAQGVAAPASFNAAVVISMRLEGAIVPVSGATVTLGGVGSRISDGNGFVNFGVIPPFDYTLTVHKPGVLSYQAPFNVQANAGSAVSILLKGPGAPEDWLEMFPTERECEQANPGWECMWTKVRARVEWFRASRPLPGVQPPTGPQLAAEIVHVAVPDEMVTGRTYRASVQLRNTGATTWTAQSQIRLGDWYGVNTGQHVWGTGRFDLPAGVQVRRGEVGTLAGNIIAPAPGTYAFDWRMLHEGVTWFGARTEGNTVTVRGSGSIIGHFDGFVREGGQTLAIGWACASLWAGSIDVHLYSGGPAGAGAFVTAGQANRQPDAAVSAACGTTSVPHRFRIPVDAFVAGHGGKAFHVHGISPHGAPNLTIAGSGAHVLGAATASPRYGSSFAFADFDNDGRADYVDRHVASGQFWVHRNLGNGTFSTGNLAFGQSSGGAGWRVLAADFTGDGHADFADLHEASGTMWIHENLRNGTFSTANWAQVATTASAAIEVLPGDFDGDRRADLLERDVVSGALRVRRNNGNGTFSLMPAATFRSTAGAEWRVLVGDFNGDRKADVADLHVPSASLWIHLGVGAPSYDFRREDAGYARATAGAGWRVIVGDFTGDGRADYADLHLPSGQLWAHEALGGGTFAPGNSAHAQTSRGSAGWQLLGE